MREGYVDFETWGGTILDGWGGLSLGSGTASMEGTRD